uniref:exodeoxyribonuclease III n=1 Tax=Acanthochromis polyacanthus TaxID=80966 RepID=A0A3Q1FSR1_9TELE
MFSKCSSITGFRVRGRRLYLHHRPVLTNSLREVLVSFIAFLQMLGHPLLIGHNIRHFDCPLLVRCLDQLQLRAEFEASVSGCVDTLPLTRELLKDRGLQSFGQENLVRELLGVNYKAHDALEDVRALQTLYGALQPQPEVICRHRFTLDTISSKRAETAAKSFECGGHILLVILNTRPLSSTYKLYLHHYRFQKKELKPAQIQQHWTTAGL